MMAFGTIAFSFVCHDSAFLMYQTLREPSAERWNKVTHMSMSAACGCCLLIAIPGFLTFRDTTNEDLLSNYSDEDPIIIAARCVYILTMAFTYPMSFFVNRHVTNVLVFRGDDFQSTQEMSLMRHLLLTLPIWGSTVIICLCTSSLSFVMSLTGGLGAVTLAFVIPPVACLKMDKLKNPDRSQWDTFLANWDCYVLMFFGAASCLVTVVQNIGQAMNIPFFM
jgi:sodium-coupled neutral amino acid transporter 11